ncbi:metal-dependent hydrolase [Halobaculum sp. EA56]|uniref:metal-dependent hydrolase n=1 Tax=Halobaculum sp. EA56 TaxID=3421648 RepID=UPI003EB6C93E
MWPWGHLAVAYLCFLLVTRYTNRVRQSPMALVALATGSQFPDLVDKPLAWSVAVLPSGRSLAHSLITIVLVLAILDRVAARYDRRALVAAFGIGWVSHAVSDLGPRVIVGLLRGDASQLRWTTYLLWPILDSPPYPNDSSFLAHFMNFRIGPYVSAQFALFALAIILWLYTGAPGARRAHHWIGRAMKRT